MIPGNQNYQIKKVMKSVQRQERPLVDDVSLDSSSLKGSFIDESKNRRKDEAPTIAKKETKAVFWWKVILLAVLLFSTLSVALAVYFYTTNSEINSFEDQFGNDAVKLLESIGSTLDISLGSIDSFLVTAASFAHYSNMTWPFVTIVSESVCYHERDLIQF